MLATNSELKYNFKNSSMVSCSIFTLRQNFANQLWNWQGYIYKLINYSYIALHFFLSPLILQNVIMAFYCEILMFFRDNEFKRTCVYTQQNCMFV